MLNQEDQTSMRQIILDGIAKLKHHHLSNCFKHSLDVLDKAHVFGDLRNSWSLVLLFRIYDHSTVLLERIHEWLGISVSLASFSHIRFIEDGHRRIERVFALDTNNSRLLRSIMKKGVTSSHRCSYNIKQFQRQWWQTYFVKYSAKKAFPIAQVWQ